MVRFLFALAGLAVLFATGPGHAKVEADPNKEYVVLPEAGPWMICVASYTGPQAPELARELVLDIRSRFDVPAYVFNRSNEERRKQREERERLQQLYPQADLSQLRKVRIEEQCAVLVGGYKDIESARRSLDDIKKLVPKDRKLMPLFYVGNSQKSENDKNSADQGAFVSPFLDSFVVPNPLAKNVRPVDPKPKEFLKELNAGESYSLLQCRQPWTLLVAAFQGTTVIQAQSAPATFLDKVMGRNAGDTLNASAQNAHNLAEALRKVPFEAYVLHTRQGSVVTVGGFSGKDDPLMRQVQEALYRHQLGPRVMLLPQPVPIEVPRL